MTEMYNGYTIKSACKSRPDRRFSVAVLIEKDREGRTLTERFEDTAISLILEIEAEKESINLGKAIIKKGLVGF